MDNSSIKENIRRIRKACRFTQEEIAAQLGISLTAYRDLEYGPTAMINGNLPKFAEVTGTSMEELMLGYCPQPSENILKEVQTEYGSRISTMQTRIADLEKLVKSLEGRLEDKEEIILMLKKNLGGEK